MKTKLSFLITTMLLISCLLLNCEKQETNEPQNENVEFAFNLNTSHLKSSPDSCESLSYATKIVLTIETISGGATDYTDTELELYKLNGSFFSPKIALLVGHYKLTKLLLIDDDNNVLFAAPLEGSTLSPQAENPLPIEFEVIANQAVSINVEVLCALNYTPEDFGLVSFWLNKVETFSFLIAVAELGEDLILDADLTVSSGDYSYNQHLEAITNNVVTVKNGFENYTLIIEKEGYSAYSKTFTSDELKLHSNSPGNLPLVIELQRNESEDLVDIDGNVYKTVQIGEQTWMAENLRTTRFNDGTEISMVTTSLGWRQLTPNPGMCYYAFNPDNATNYGALYNWYAVGTNKLCPVGWHVPTDEEWQILADELGGTQVAGGPLKEAGYEHWYQPNTGATNSTGFTGLPTGCIEGSGNFVPLGHAAHYFSATSLSDIQCGEAELWRTTNILYLEVIYKPIGHSVRCVKN